MKTNKTKILDCTIRDGGYLNNWHFDKKMVRGVYKALSKAGIDIVEIGFRGTEKYFDRKKFGSWRFTDLEDLRHVVSGVAGARIALMGDYGKIESDDFPVDYLELVSLVRIAAHKNGTSGAIRELEKIKKKGFEVSLQAMGITSYTEREVRELIAIIKNSDIDYIYMADSYGSILPDQVRSLIEQFKILKHTKVGFHPHNSLQMAFANTLEAIKCGVDIVDSTIYGMGRGAGNLPTEVLLSYLQLSTKDKYNVIPVLDCIDRFFMKIDVDEPWGYQLPYMLSGIFQCHPYYPKTLVDYREFSMEDIWNALEVLRKLNPVGFSKDALNDIIKSGMIGGIKMKGTSPDKADTNKTPQKRRVAVPYKDRHKGRDFLILANGPTLQEYRPKIEKFIKKYNPIILGANYLSGFFKPHYHAFNNKKRFEDYIDPVDEKAI